VPAIARRGVTAARPGMSPIRGVARRRRPRWRPRPSVAGYGRPAKSERSRELSSCSTGSATKGRNPGSRSDPLREWAVHRTWLRERSDPHYHLGVRVEAFARFARHPFAPQTHRGRSGKEDDALRASCRVPWRAALTSLARRSEVKGGASRMFGRSSSPSGCADDTPSLPSFGVPNARSGGQTAT
jgi:hypothetical protein